MGEHDKISDHDLDFNDGVGDLLVDREKSFFNVWKMVIVAAGIILLLTATFGLSFVIGKKLIETAAKNTQISQKTVNEQIANMNKNHNELVAKLAKSQSSHSSTHIDRISENTATQSPHTATAAAISPVPKSSSPTQSAIKSPRKATGPVTIKFSHPPTGSVTVKLPHQATGLAAPSAKPHHHTATPSISSTRHKPAPKSKPNPTGVPLTPASSTPLQPKPAASTQLIIVVGSFKNPINATALSKELGDFGYSPVISRIATGQTIWYRVSIGPFKSMTEASAETSKLDSSGYPYFLMSQ